MFRAMADGDSNLLKSLSHKFIEAHSHSTAALLCLDVVFQKAMNIQIAPAEVVLQTLQNFATFTREMQNLLSQPEPLLQPDIQRLFAVSQIVEMADVFLVRKGSFLHSRIAQSGQVSIIATDEAENYQLHAPELTRVFQDAVRMRLNRRTADEDFVCSKAESLRLCPAFLAFGTCNSNCGSSHDSAAVGQPAYHMRIRNILQQILICQLTRASEDLSRQQTCAVHFSFAIWSFTNVKQPVDFQTLSLHVSDAYSSWVMARNRLYVNTGGRERSTCRKGVASSFPVYGFVPKNRQAAVPQYYCLHHQPRIVF